MIRSFIVILILVFSLKAMAFVPKSFKADFSNTYTSQVSGKEKTSVGNLSFMAPKSIRFEITKPDQILFISNDKKSWYYNPPAIPGEPGELKVGKPDPYQLLEFFKALENGLASGKNFDAKNETGKSLLKFKKHFSDKFKMAEAELAFTGPSTFTNITDLKIIYTDGKKIQIKFSQIATDVSLQQKDFQFEPPENTVISN